MFNLFHIGLKGWVYMSDAHRNAIEVVASGIIAVSDDFVEIAQAYHSGQPSMLYAVASSGCLARGTVRPYVHEDNAWREATDAEWMYELASALASELRRVREVLEQNHEVEGAALEVVVQFQEYIDGIVAAIENHILPPC